jgi:Protein of unknown function (DUF1573)
MNNSKFCKIVYTILASMVSVAAVNLTLSLVPRYDEMSAPRPVMHISDCTVNLGEISPSEFRDVSFLIENKGTRRLVLNHFTCGCGEPKRYPILVQAGKTNNVTVHFEANQEFGPMEQTVSFTTNDEAKPRVDLTVIAMVTEK